MEKEKVRVGVFCDFENTRYTMEKTFSVGKFDIEKYIGVIVKYLTKFDSCEVKKNVYGCFDINFFNYKLLHTAETFKKNNFNIQNVPVKKCGQDRSDMQIGVDICHHLFKLDDIDHYIIFSGDSDFSYLLQTIKKNNKIVTIMSLDSALSEDLKLYANEVVVITPTDLIENYSATIIQSVDNETEKKLTEWREFIEKVISLTNYFEEKSGENGFLALSYFREKYQERYQVSDEKFNEILEKAKDESLILIEKKPLSLNYNPVSCIAPNMENKLVIIVNQEMINK